MPEKIGVIDATPPAGLDVVAVTPVAAELFVAVAVLAWSGDADTRLDPPVAVEFMTCVPVVAAVVPPCIWTVWV